MSVPVPLPPWKRRGSLVPLARMHAANAAGDALVTIALADTFFFDVPLGEARGRVALYLLVTMAPFAIVAPVIGPLLDRLRSGRRLALAASFGGRAVLAWWMAAGPGGLRLYPAAFGVLVLSKGYGIARAAAVPRLLPQYLTLVGANSRLAATALAGGTAAGAVGVGIARGVGTEWTLRLGTLVFLAGAAFALALPAAVNSAAATPDLPVRQGGARFVGAVRAGLTGTAALRAGTGFLTLFLAFLLRQRGGAAALPAALAAAAAGGLAGTALGGILRERPPEALLGGAMGLATTGFAVAAWSFSLGTAAFAAACAGLAGSLGKLAYDALLQRDVDDDVRGSVFARSETTLQLAWVVGGALGITLPLRPGLGLGVAAVGLAAASVVTVRRLRAAVAGPPEPSATT